MKNVLLLVLLSFIGITPVMALCAQAFPNNCAWYAAVACDPAATGKSEVSGPNFASASVYSADFTELSSQVVECCELDGSCGGHGGVDGPGGCTVSGGAWWVGCDPFIKY